MSDHPAKFLSYVAVFKQNEELNMADGPYSQALISSPGLYHIYVKGRIDTKWADYLHGMTITTIERSDKTGGALTELSGQLPDQAALMGVLWQLYSLGVPLISVKCIRGKVKKDKTKEI